MLSLVACLLHTATCEPSEPSEPVTLDGFFSTVIIEDVQPDQCDVRLKRGDRLWVDYTGWLPDGSVFGTSRAWKPAGSAPSEPFGPFVLGDGQVIAGVDKGLVGMCLGGLRTLLIPAHEAYGEVGTDIIPPNSALKMQYEITRVHPKFKITVERSSDAPCTSAAGEGTELTLQYTAFYGVIESGNHHVSGAVSWKPLPGTSVSQDDLKTRWGPFVLSRDMDIIAGLYQGLLGICPGETRHLLIPPDLAYGDVGRDDSRHVPPHASMFFSIDVLELKKPGMKIDMITRGLPGSVVTYGNTITLSYSVFIVSNADDIWSTGWKENQLEVLEKEAQWGPFVFDEDVDMITGLRYGLLGMAEGETRNLLIQPQLAWNAGVDGYIRGNATVLFKLTLTSLACAPLACKGEQAGKLSHSDL